MKDWELIDLGKQLSSFVVGTEGNISKRTEEGFRIKGSGTSLNLMDFSLVECDIDGKPLPNQTSKPSMEASFHSWIYKNSDFQIIAHTHPTNLLKILCTDYTNEFAHSRMFPDQVVFNGKESCAVSYATPGASLTAQIAASVEDFKNRHLYFPKLLLLENHGLVCCANSSKEAIIMTEICEKAAEIFIGSKLLGTISPLSPRNIEDVASHEDEKYRRSLT
jgi:ribulose-5-phosphate 4-epimerase/fuculose-1-phosphate aldolase